MAYFTNYLYVTNDAETIQCRISNNTFTAQPTPPAIGIATIPGSVSFGISSRRRDLRGRFVTLKRTTGTGADRKSFFTRLGILSPTDFNSVNMAIGAPVTVNGVVYAVSSKTGESLK